MEKMKLNIQLFGTWGSSYSFDKKLNGQVGYNNVSRNGQTVTVTWGSRVQSNWGSFGFGMGGCSYWKLGNSTGGNTTKYYGKGASGSYTSGKWYYTDDGNTSKSASVTGERYDFSASTTVSGPEAGSLTLETYVWTYDSTSGYNSYAYPKVTVSYPAAATCTVTFNADGGLGGPSTQTYYVGYAQALTTDQPYKTGYTFDGWYTSPGRQGTKYTGGTSYTFNSNITLYAGWTINSYWNDINAFKPDDITQNGLMFDLYTSDGGEWLNITNEPSSFTKEYYTQAVIENIRPNVTGAHYTTNSVTGDDSDRIEWYFLQPSYTVTLYSAWNTYTVVYNANGGTGSTQSSTHTYNTAKNLTLNGFSRSGYDFMGWSTNSSATTATYSDGQSVSNLTTVNNGTVTLYAVWRVTKPSNVRFTNTQVTGPFNISLAWTCTGLSVNYTIYYKKSTASSWTSVPCGASTSLTLAVDEETTYDIYVSATNAGGTTDSTHIQLTTPADQAKIRIYTGNAWVQGKTYIYTGSSWIKAKKVYVYDGNQWRINSNN